MRGKDKFIKFFFCNDEWVKFPAEFWSREKPWENFFPVLLNLRKKNLILGQVELKKKIKGENFKKNPRQKPLCREFLVDFAQ
ncbi:MAG: hypothetical protein CM15mP51_23330 [Porticoccaceae bacterium]|nr:MAG: hypothetical protein CM15mP51_23330 [Porticoccaceae bacterium]